MASSFVHNTGKGNVSFEREHFLNLAGPAIEANVVPPSSKAAHRGTSRFSGGGGGGKTMDDMYIVRSSRNRKMAPQNTTGSVGRHHRLKESPHPTAAMVQSTSLHALGEAPLPPLPPSASPSPPSHPHAAAGKIQVHHTHQFHHHYFHIHHTMTAEECLACQKLGKLQQVDDNCWRKTTSCSGGTAAGVSWSVRTAAAEDAIQLDARNGVKARLAFQALSLAAPDATIGSNTGVSDANSNEKS